MANIFGKYRNTSQEFINGTSADDVIYPGGGWDVVNGGAGVDTVHVEGRSNQFKLVAEDGVVYIDSLSAASAYSERVQLINIEKVQFWDELVDLRVSKVFRDGESSVFIAGGPGSDSMIYSGVRANYTLEKSGAYTFVKTDPSLGVGSGYRSDRLESIETIQFADQAVSFSLPQDSVAGQASRLISVVLGPQFLNDPVLAGVVVSALNQGRSLQDLASLGANTDLFISLAGGSTNENFVRLVYQNLMGSAPSTSDLQLLTGLIDSGAYSKGSLAVAAVSLTESLGKVDFTGLASQGWAYNLVS